MVTDGTIYVYEAFGIIDSFSLHSNYLPLASVPYMNAIRWSVAFFVKIW